MSIWSAEIKELERLNAFLAGHFPMLEKEMGLLLRTEDENVAMLYSRRCLEVIVTDLCETELNRPRKTEPLKGIIDKLNKEEKVPSYIITSMHGLNSLSTYGAHPKDFDPDQVKPALSNLAIIMKWYLSYKDIEILIKPLSAEEEAITGDGKQITDTTKLEKSVAVLPFINDSPDQENTYFINGVMEEILNNLQKIKDLRVISRTSAEKYRGQNKSISEIAEELGVNYIVEGSGQKYGNAFRLRAQLIMAEHESHLWGESFQQKITDVEDIFNIQIKIAESIATELKAVISPEERRLIEKIPTKSTEAYDAWLKGMFYWRKLTPNDLETAMKYFELAKEKDSEYAPAFAGISFVWGGLMQMGHISPEEAGPKIMEALMKALELDKTDAEVIYTQACMNTWVLWDWEGGESAFKKALALNPNHAEAHAYYSHFLNIMGKPEEAMKEIEIALKLDPHNPLLISLYSVDLLFVRRIEEAKEAAQEAIRMEPVSPVGQTALTWAMHITGRFKEAWESIKTEFTYLGQGQAFNQDFDELGYVRALNKAAEALTILGETTYVNPFLLADVYLLAGNKERALDWLEKAYEIRETNLPYLLTPICDIIRDEPRFQEIARKMNLPYK
jgi:adenylate cyclase